MIKNAAYKIYKDKKCKWLNKLINKTFQKFMKC